MPKFGEPGAPERGPGGRLKVIKSLETLARSHTELAISVLVAVCKDKTESGSARVQAANILLDRGWGKAKQNVTVDGSLNVTKLSDADLDETIRNELAAFIVGSHSGENGAKDQEFIN